MAIGDFTKEEAVRVEAAFGMVMDVIPKRKIAEVFGYCNEIALFIAAAKRKAPNEKK